MKVFSVSVSDTSNPVLVKAKTAKAAIKFAAQNIEATEVPLDELLNAVRAGITIHDTAEVTTGSEPQSQELPFDAGQ
jgi:hypothetical protein